MALLLGVAYPLRHFLIAVIALLVVGGGVYVYESNKTEAPIPIDVQVEQSDQTQQPNVQNNPVNSPTQNTQALPSGDVKVTSPTSNESQSFNIIFKYGVGAKNVLNTFAKTYTKDMVIEKPVTIGFELSGSDLNDINQKIVDLGLLDKTPVLNSPIIRMATPCSSYYLKVQTGTVLKELSWDECKGDVRDEFRQFINYMMGIIQSKSEYKQLPEAKGAYL